MAILITGGCGAIGAPLARSLAERGARVIAFDVADKPMPGVETILGDVSVAGDVFDAIRTRGVKRVFHLGAMLTAASEARPWRSMQVNVDGTRNVLEAARTFGVEHVLFASSIAVFGPQASGATIADDSPQRPATIYGSAKLFGENLGFWYARRFGLDFRVIRYPQMIAPGIRIAPHWAPPMIEDVLRGGVHDCAYGGDARSIMLHLEDAVRATAELMEADLSAAAVRAYNVGGVRTALAPAELAGFLRARFPGARISIVEDGKDDGGRVAFDDSRARADWGWRPRHDSVAAVVDAFARDIGVPRATAGAAR